MNRKQRERLATIAAVLWRPFDRPEVPEEPAPAGKKPYGDGAASTRPMKTTTRSNPPIFASDQSPNIERF
jgi:hypothetical protein